MRPRKTKKIDDYKESDYKEKTKNREYDEKKLTITKKEIIKRRRKIENITRKKLTITKESREEKIKLIVK